MTDVRTHNPAPTPTKDKVAEAASDVAASVTDQAQGVAQTATTEVRDVATHAIEQVSTLTAETREHALAALSSATGELETQLDQRLGDATSVARTTADELRALCEGRPEDAGRTAEFARQASQRLDRFAERTDQLGARGAAEEIADFGRRRPVAFLLGATVAGVLVGRMVRAGSSAKSAASAAEPSAPSVPAAASVPATPPTVGPSTRAGAPSLAPANPAIDLGTTGGPADAPIATPSTISATPDLTAGQALPGADR